MIIKVLGSAAGGGFPQANCNCRNCADVRAGQAGAAPAHAIVASPSAPTAGAGCCSTPRPTCASRSTPRRSWRRARTAARALSPIAAVVLTNGDVDHVAGLLSLREGFAFSLYASERVLGALAANTIFNVLDAQLVPREASGAGDDRARQARLA